MQKVAEMIEPLKDNEGFACRGSISVKESCLTELVKLIRRRMSRPDFAPDAASLGDCAILSRISLILCVKYDWDAPEPPLSEAYVVRPMPGVTGTFVTEGRRPG
jgi:hypothetical protein